MVLLNAKIVSMDNRENSEKPGHIYQAMAISGNQISALGSDGEMRGQIHGPHTKVIDAGGRTVIPGIIDVATHPETAGIFYRDSEAKGVFMPEHTYSVDFRLPDSIYLDQVRSTLAGAVAVTPPGEWILIKQGGPDSGMGGRRARAFYLISTVEPAITRGELTSMAPNNPVIVGYQMNQKAIEVLRQELPPLMAAAFEEANWKFGPGELNTIWPYEVWGKHAGIDREIEVLRVELEMLPKVGVTTYSARFPSPKTYDVLHRMRDTGQLPVRVEASTEFIKWAPSDQRIKVAEETPANWGPIDERLWIGGAAYEHMWWAPSEGGEVNATEAVVEAIKNGWRPSHLHVFVNNAFGWEFIELLKKTGLTKEQVRKLRPHTLHADWLTNDPELWKEMAEWGIHQGVGGPTNFGAAPYPVALFGQPPEIIPGFPVKDGHYPGIPIKTMLENGMKLAMESDNVVTIGSETARPFNLLEFVVTREWHNVLPYGGGTIDLNEAVDRVVGLKMQTTWASEFVFQEDKIGTLEKGKLADFLVLNQDVLTVEAKKIHNTKPILTVIDGKILYSDGTIGGGLPGPCASCSFPPDR
jgi:predicted amidohydrolase YtcJ